MGRFYCIFQAFLQKLSVVTHKCIFPINLFYWTAALSVIGYSIIQLNWKNTILNKIVDLAFYSVSSTADLVSHLSHIQHRK